MNEKASKIKAEPRRWFRFYAEAVNDPKVQRLPAHLFKTWINLLCLASSNGGQLPRSEDVAFQLRMSDHDAQTQIDELIGLGLIDITPEKVMEPHNWQSRQYVSDTSTERTKKYREKKKKQACDVTVTAEVTPPEQNRTDSETDSESPTTTKVNFSTVFEPSYENDGLIVTEAGQVRLSAKQREFWLAEFGGSDKRLDMALLQVTVQRSSRESVLVQVNRHLARIASDKLDKDQRYQSAVAANAAAKAAPKPVKLSRWGA